MEGTIAEVRLFASNFAPKNWLYCQGQIMPISQNTAMFSLLGTTYGGNGQTTFGLPNLKDSVAIGAGQGPGLTYRALGEAGGSNAVSLLQPQMPAHTHAVTSSVTVKAANALATDLTPTAGYSLANTKLPNDADLLEYNSATPDITLNQKCIDVSITMNQGVVMGSGLSHSNQQHYLSVWSFSYKALVTYFKI
jgi:microcystin-dependent protein